VRQGGAVRDSEAEQQNAQRSGCPDSWGHAAGRYQSAATARAVDRM
jgi:hypothetical protein